MPLLVVLAAASLALLWFVVLPRLPHPDWTMRVAAGPLPEAVDTVAEQAAWRVETSRTISWVTAEKVGLVGLLSVIFAQTLPGVRASDTQLFVGIGVFVVVNAAITLAAARREVGVESLVLTSWCESRSTWASSC